MKSEKKQEAIVIEDDLTFFESTEGFPYLKHIELVFYTPQHFDLNQWESNFTIPDHWMQKLYKDEMYIDTECPPRPEPERISKEQKELIKDYLRTQKRRRDSCLAKTRNRKLDELPIDNLMDELESIGSETEVAEKSFNSSPSSTCKAEPKLGIKVLRKHKVQTEDNIVRKSVDKMKYRDEERRYRSLLKDREYMDSLNRQVEIYIMRTNNL